MPQALEAADSDAAAVRDRGAVMALRGELDVARSEAAQVRLLPHL